MCMVGINLTVHLKMLLGGSLHCYFSKLQMKRECWGITFFFITSYLPSYVCGASHGISGLLDAVGLQ